MRASGQNLASLNRADVHDTALALGGDRAPAKDLRAQPLTAQVDVGEPGPLLVFPPLSPPRSPDTIKDPRSFPPSPISLLPARLPAIHTAAHTPGVSLLFRCCSSANEQCDPTSIGRLPLTLHAAILPMAET